MIVEHEILEQLLDQDWTLIRTIAFLEDMKVDAWQIILRHVQDQNMQLVDEKDDALPYWKVQEIIRAREASVSVLVHCTKKGGRLVT